MKKRIPLLIPPASRGTGKTFVSGKWKPQPIQRSRTKKQISPNALVTEYVGRPTKYGNPFKLIGDIIYGNARHRRKIFDPWVYIEIINPEKANERLVELYLKWILRDKEVLDMHIIPCPFTIDEIQLELKNKNLSCWCKLSEPCHRNVLLTIANEKKVAVPALVDYFTLRMLDLKKKKKTI